MKYEERWSRSQPGDRTTWSGLFSGNKDLNNVTIFNVYSRTDYVLRADLGRADFLNPHHWFTCKRHQKPNTGLADTLEDYTGGKPDGWRDTVGVQFWGTLGGASLTSELAADEYLWPSGNHAGLIRQWAELAFWFPAVSGAAGAQPLATFVDASGDRNISMEEYSGSGYNNSPGSRENSHSYFWVKTPADVWRVYEKLAATLPH